VTTLQARKHRQQYVNSIVHKTTPRYLPMQSKETKNAYKLQHSLDVTDLFPLPLDTRQSNNFASVGIPLN